MRLPAADAASGIRLAATHGSPDGLAGTMRNHCDRRLPHRRPQRGRTAGLDGSTHPCRGRPVLVVSRRVCCARAAGAQSRIAPAFAPLPPNEPGARRSACSSTSPSTA
jgi:hypothetical protein